MRDIEWFVRFKKNLINEKASIKLFKDDDSKKTRYAVIKEDENSYYINQRANFLTPCTFVKINKKQEGILYDVYIESV